MLRDAFAVLARHLHACDMSEDIRMDCFCRQRSGCSSQEDLTKIIARWVSSGSAFPAMRAHHMNQLERLFTNQRTGHRDLKVVGTFLLIAGNFVICGNFSSCSVMRSRLQSADLNYEWHQSFGQRQLAISAYSCLTGNEIIVCGPISMSRAIIARDN